MKKSIFLFFAAILCAMTANAYNQSAVDLYFDNSEAKWSSCYVYIGHSTWTSCYPLTRVSGTQYLWKLAKADFNGGGAWNGATGWVLCYEKWWDSKGESIDKFTWHGDKNVTQKRTSAWSASYIYKTNGTASTTSDSHTITAYKTTTVSNKNYTVTINTVEGGTLTVKDYDNNAVATGASKIYLTVLKFTAAPADGYVLDAVEINDGTNTTTIAAADLATTTHTLKSNVTINPVWRATTSTVTVTTSATNGTVTGAGVYEEGNSVTLTATADAGYQFKNWTVAGAEVSTANPYTFTVDADITVTANFEETPKVTVYFVNNSGWSKIQAYAWDGTKGANPGWPGADITANKLGEQIGGFDVYSYTVEQGSYGKVIFNNGSAQTADYVWTDGNYYWHNEAANFAGGTKAQAEEKFSVPVEYDYVYFINTNSWAAVNIYTWTPEVATWPGEAMTKETEQIAGFDVYSYKVVKGTTFGGMKFSDNGGTQTGDLQWQASKYYAPSKETWYADAAAAEAGLAAPVVYTYTVVGSSAPLFGEAWATGKVENDMTLVEGTKYELVKTDVSLTVGEIQYKVAVNHAWDEAYPGENAILNISEAGKYTVTFTFDSNTKAVNATAELTEAAVVLPTVGVKGAWDGWAATTTLTGDNTSAAAIVNITTADVYEFGLDVDGNFQASGATIDKANNSTVVTTNAGNMKLTANILGEYTFTWTYETNTLTVTYPAGEEVEIAKKYYIAGTEELTGFNWQVDGLQLTKDGDLYKHTFSALAAGTFEFKVTNGTWTDPWGFGNLSAAYEEVSEGTDGEGNPNGNIKFTTEEAKNITVIFDATAGKITIDGLTEKVPVEKHYYLIGTFNEWTLADANYELALVDGLYKKEVTLAKDAEFKVNDGADAWWGKDNLGDKTYEELEGLEDGNLKMLEEKTFTIIFNPAEHLITFEGLTEKAPAPTTYTVAGDSEAAFGTTWDPTNTANDMALEDGLYKWTKTNVALYANTVIKFQVVRNHDWAQGQWPGQNNDWELKDAIAADGLYTITITFKEDDKTINATATKTGDIVIKDFSNQPATLYFHPSFHWTSDAAQFAAYFYNNGPGADATPTWVNMTDGDGDGIYEVVNAKQHEYVIICRMNPDRTENNWEDEVMWNQIEHGITIPNTADDLNTCLAFWTNCQGDVPTSECTWVAPTPLTDKNWDAFIAAYNGKTINAVVERSFNSSQNHTLCLPFNLPTSWLGEESKAYQLNSIFANTTTELQLNASECNTIEAGKPYIIVPVKGGEYEHIIVSDVTVKEVAAGTNVATGDGYKATLKAVTTTGGQTNGSTEYYVGANDGCLYNAVVDKLGLRAIIELTTIEGQALPANVRARIAQSDDTTTGFENITTTDKAVKVIENGQLIIIRDGVKYNAQGQRF